MGTAMSGVMKKINTAVMEGGKSLEGFAEVSGMSASDFKKAWEKDPYKALTQFEKGIKGVIDSGGNATETLKDLKISESRQQDTVLRLAGGYKQLDDANKIANEGWKESNALSREAEQKYKTLGSKIQIFKNHVFALGKSIGEALAPALIKIMDVLTPFVKALTTAPDSVKILVVSLMALPVVIAPVMFALAGITGIFASAGTAIETFTEMSKSGGKSLTFFGKMAKFVVSPLGTMKNVISKMSFKSFVDHLKMGTRQLNIFGKQGLITTKILPLLKTGITGVGRALKFAFITNPVVGPLLLLGGALVLAYKKVEWFREGINAIVKVAGQVAVAIGKDLFGAFKALIGIVVKAGKAVGDWFVDVGNKIKNTKIVKGMDLIGKSFSGLIKNMTKKSSHTSDVFDGISKGTEKALKEYVKFSEGTTRAFEQIKYDSGRLTKETQAELSKNIREGGRVAVKEVQKRNKQISDNLKKTLSHSESLSKEQKDNIIKRANEEAKLRTDKIKDLNKEIKALEEKAYGDGRLSAKEKKAIESKLKERNELTVKYLSQGQKEQQAILSRMTYNTGGIKVSEASLAIKDNAKAEAKALKEAKRIRDKAIMDADKSLADGTINKNQHRSVVLDIESDYDARIDKVKKKSKELEDAIKKHNPKISTKINMSTGEEYSAGQQWWNGFKKGLMDKAKSGTASLVVSVAGMIKSSGDWYNSANETADKWGRGFTDGWDNFWTGVGDWFNSVQNSFTNSLSGSHSWFVKKGEDFGNWVKEGWNNFTSGLSGWWSGLINGISSSIGTVKSWFVKKGGELFNSLKTGWENIVQTGGNLWNSLTEKLGSTWGTIKTWFITKGKDIWGNLKSGWSSAINSGKSLWSTLTEKLSSTFGTIKSWFITKGKEMANGLKSGWNSVVSVTTSFFSGIWNAMKIGWKNVYNFTVTTYRDVKNYLYNIWKNIYDKVKYWLDLTWSKVKGTWNNVYSKTTQIYSLVKSYIYDAWKYVYDKIKYWIELAYNKIKNTFNFIYNKILNTMRDVKSYIYNAWKYIYDKIKYYIDLAYNKVKTGFQNIYNKATGLAKSTKKFVVDKFKEMYEGAKKWIDSIGDWLVKAKEGMGKKARGLGISVANGAINGLNKMIGGINKISKAITEKNLIKEIPPIKASTGTRKARNLSNSKGQLKKDTPVIVNDKGQGNGKGPNGHQEIIIRKDGSMFAPQGKDVLLNLKKGESVVSGTETQQWQQQGIIPEFSTSSRTKMSKKKKKEQEASLLEKAKAISGGFNAVLGHTAHNIKADAKEKAKMVGEAYNNGKAKLKAGVSYVGGKIGDVWEYMSNPGKLVNIALDKVRGMFGGNNATMEMAKLSFDKLKNLFKNKVQSMFDEYGGGDGGYLFDYPIWQRFGKYTGGLGFNGGNHFGVDFGMPIGTHVSAVKGGIVDKVWNDYGGGKSVQVKTGANEWNWYMHLSKILASAGQKIKTGGAIGKSGDTGNFIRGAHLHLQVMKGSPGNGNAIDAIPWLKALEGSGGGRGGLAKPASQWMGEIRKAASIMGAGASASDMDLVARLIQTESGGNSGILQQVIDQNTGANKARGLLQYVPSTFNSYKVRGHGNIHNGMDQLIAFFNNTNWKRDLYAWQRRMASGSTGWGPSGARKKYANGGIIRKHSIYEGAEGNKPEMVIPLTKKARAMELIAEAKRYMGISETESSKTYNVTHNTNNTSPSNEYLITMIELMQQQNAMLMQLVQSNNVIAEKELLVHEGSFQKEVYKAVDKKNFKEKRRDKYRN